MLSGGTFRNETRTAVLADGLKVDQGLFCGEGFVAEGEVRLIGAHITGQLNLTGEFNNPNGNAIFASGLRVDLVGMWEPKEASGALVVRFAHATVWTDNCKGRDTATALRGFRYEALRSRPNEISSRERIEWLNRDPDGYSPQPYTQLAAIYRAEGYDQYARAILVASEDRRRGKVRPIDKRRRGRDSANRSPHDCEHECEKVETRSWPGRVWAWVLWGIVGYGYYPWLALLWLLSLVAIGTLVITCHPDNELTRNAGAPPRNALLYTLDVLLPFIDLGYGKWTAHGAVLIATSLLVVFGWVLATAVVAAFAGVLRRGD